MIIKKENRNLLFLGLAAAFFLTIAPIQNIKAGYYQYYDDFGYGGNEDSSEDSEDTYTYVSTGADHATYFL